MHISKYVGNEIRKIRRKHNIDQKKLAKILDAKQSSISAYENGESEMNYDKLYRFAKYFEINISDLFPSKMKNMPSLTNEDKELIQSIIKKLHNSNSSERDKLKYGVNLAMKFAEREEGE